MSEILPPQLIVTLSQFAKKKETSAYEVCNLLKGKPFACAYKNVHERVQTLSSLQLIEKVNKLFTEHGAIYYTLTNYGIEHLLRYHRSEGADYNLNQLFENYGNEDVFKMLIYNSLGKSTILALRNEFVLSCIGQYLEESVSSLWNARWNISEIKSNRFAGSVTSERQTKPIASHKKAFRITASRNLLKLVFSIIQISDATSEIDPNFELTRDHDLRLLTKDLRFKSLLGACKEYVIRSYDSLMKYSESSGEK